MIFKNYYYLGVAAMATKFGRGKTFTKRLFNTQRILEKNYTQGQKFCFLQVGANDGKSFDFIFDFAIKRQLSGVLIEPITEYYEELCANYHLQQDVLKINKAVHKTAQRIHLFKIDPDHREGYPDWVKGIASFNREHLTKFDFIREGHILKESVRAAPLMEIVKKSKIKHFDYFQVDTEGYDYEVLNMFDFSVYRPSLIKAEFINLEATQKIETKRLLIKNGYYVFFEGIDIVGINLNKLKL